MKAPLPVLIPNDSLDFAIASAPEHLKPIYRAVRHGGCDHLLMTPGGPAFRPGRNRPLIVLIGDDLPWASGPGAFHRKTLLRIFRAAGNVSMMVGAPVPEGYAQTCRDAVVSGRTVVIIETTEEREAEWISLVKLANPSFRVKPRQIREGVAA